MLRLLEKVSHLEDKSCIFYAAVLQYTCYPKGIIYFGKWGVVYFILEFYVLGEKKTKQENTAKPFHWLSAFSFAGF